MKTSEVQKLEEANDLLRAWTRQQYVAACSMAIPLIAGVLAARVLPSGFGIMAVSIGSAMGLSMGVWLIPNDFRGRSGSFVPAICLVAMMWIAALVSVVFSLLGWIA